MMPSPEVIDGLDVVQIGVVAAATQAVRARGPGEFPAGPGVPRARELGGTPQPQFAAQVRTDYVRWTSLIKQAGVKLD